MVTESVIPGRRIDRTEQFDLTSRQSCLLDQLTPRHVGDVFAFDVTHPGGDLDDPFLVRGAILLHEHHRGVSLRVEHERHDADRAR